MFIKEIELRNFMDIPDTHLKFQCSSCIYIVHGAGDGPLRNVISRAIEMICSCKYDSLESLQSVNLLNKGYVRIVFTLMLEVGVGDGPNIEVLDQSYNDEIRYAELSEEDDDAPCTSKEALYRQERRKQKERSVKAHVWNRSFHTLDVLRDFSTNPEVVTYRLNNLELVTCTLPVFQARFYLNVDYLLPRLSTIILRQRFGKTNWLELISTENTNCGSCTTSDLNGLFKRFISLFEDTNYNTSLDNITKTCVNSYQYLRRSQKISILETFRDVREIFEYLACNKYSVYFLIPIEGELYEISSCNFDDLDFTNMSTLIRRCNQTNLTATNCEDVGFLQDLLYISFKLVLAYHCKQRIVYIRNLDWLGKYESDQLMYLMYFRNHEAAENFKRNYIQRIADAAIQLGLMTVLEYSENLIVDITNVNTINCIQSTETAEWTMSIEKEGHFNLQNFMNVIHKRFFEQL